jgi:hypothetical protein
VDSPRRSRDRQHVLPAFGNRVGDGRHAGTSVTNGGRPHRSGASNGPTHLRAGLRGRALAAHHRCHLDRHQLPGCHARHRPCGIGGARVCRGGEDGWSADARARIRWTRGGSGTVGMRTAWPGCSSS